MYRPSPVRNQRSKGIKIKHVLQVCLLVAVCFWLIFQLKRSHDKKQEFDASDPKISSSTHTKSSDEIVKFGRKDLQPKLEETTKEVEIHEEVEEQEEEQEDNKHEVEDQDEDKIEEEKDDERGGADDEIDENEQEKIKVEIDREEMNTIDEDKETEEIEEKENENENEEKDEQNQTENTGSLDNHDEDGSTVHTNEAREEHYKADDASSAVTNENGNGTLDNSNGNNVGLVENGARSNTTMIQEITSESNLTSLNSTESIDAHENGPPSNTTVTKTESTQAQNVTDGGTDYISDVLKSESNSSKTEVENEGENLENKEGTEETLESYETKPEELDQNEIIDSDDPSHLEEKEVRTDLETLPEIETEGGNSEDTAAE